MAHHVPNVRSSSTVSASAFFFLFFSCFLLVLQEIKTLKISTLAKFWWMVFLLRWSFFLYAVEVFSIVVANFSIEVERISHSILLGGASTDFMVR